MFKLLIHQFKGGSYFSYAPPMVYGSQFQESMQANPNFLMTTQGGQNLNAVEQHLCFLTPAQQHALFATKFQERQVIFPSQNQLHPKRPSGIPFSKSASSVSALTISTTASVSASKKATISNSF